MNFLAHVADHVIGRPLFLHPSKLAVIADVLSVRIGLSEGDGWAARVVEGDEVPSAFFARLRDKPAANRMVGKLSKSGLYTVADGVGIIPVVGTLVNRGAWVGEDGSGATSYEGLQTQLAAAVADNEVGHILLDIDSPGGEATGMFGMTDAIRRARAVKPVTALVNDMAASAAYGIASSASEVVVSPTSIAGSIGVVMMHVDRSEEMKMRGRKVSYIHAGAHKVDGNAYGPLSDDVRAALQKDVDTFMDRFVEQVTAGRSNLTGDAIRAMEANTFIGQQAIDIGLADRVGSFAETLARAQGALRARGFNGGYRMDTISRAEHEQALQAAVETARRDATEAGKKLGADAASKRIGAILALPSAKSREQQAQQLALTTDMTAEDADKFLQTMPASARVPPVSERPTIKPENGPEPSETAGNHGWDAAMETARKERERIGQFDGRRLPR